MSTPDMVGSGEAGGEQHCSFQVSRAFSQGALLSGLVSSASLRVAASVIRFDSAHW